jgi:Dolichyl-phosphate-mannose-protein mannosyltransferase
MVSASTDDVRIGAAATPTGQADVASRAGPIAIVTSVLLAIGVALRVWQYLADTSLWYDELSIARNMHERSLATLMLHPLGYDQIAPLGFLAPVKISTLLFGDGDQVLRLFPFLCGIAGLFLFWRVAVRILSDTGVPIAVGLFALAIPLVRYTAEVKQYGLDVLATLALTLVALDLRTHPATVRRCVFAGIAGLVIVWFSQAAVLVMAGLGAALVLCWLWERDERARRTALITVPLWALASIVGLVVSGRYTTPDTLAFMHMFWRRQGAFAPLPPTFGHDTVWAWDRIVQFFVDVWMLRYPWPMLYATLAIVGFALLWRRRDVALLVLGPIAVTFAAAIAHAYPFRARVVLFLLPSVLIALTETLDTVLTLAASVNPMLAAGALVALAGPPVYAVIIHPPPYAVESFKPVLAYVGTHRQAGDVVYVHPNAYEAVDHYGPRFGLPPDSYVVGVCDARDLRPYLVDVDRFRGASRVWVIGSSVAPYRVPRQAIDRYLRAIGMRRDSVGVASLPPLDPVSAELFDLSDTTRLQSATASSFQAGSLPDTLPPVCRDRIRPTPPPARAR